VIVCQSSKFNPVNAMLILVADLSSDVQGETGFPAASRACERKQARGCQQLHDLCHLMFPPDKAGQYDWKVRAWSDPFF
jgi:hypothetical protein